MKADVQEKWDKINTNIKALPVDNATLKETIGYGRATPKEKNIPLPVIHFILYEVNNKWYSYILDFGILVKSEKGELHELY